MKIDGLVRRVELASGFTVGDYLEAIENQNKTIIADAIHRRFIERYLAPVSRSGAYSGDRDRSVRAIVITRSGDRDR